MRITRLPAGYSRNAIDLTARLQAIAAAAARIKASSFTMDGEAVVLDQDGLRWQLTTDD